MSRSVADIQLLPVAQIVKSYDTNGEIVIRQSSKILEDHYTKGPVFLYFDGLSVPFFIEKYRTKGASGAIIKFEGIDDLSHSEELLKKEIFISAQDMSEEIEQEELSMADYLIGCTIKDGKNKIIGKISDYLDYPGNPCIEVEPSGANSPDQTILIPFNEELIIKFDPKKRTLQMEIPQGLLEL